MKKDMQKRNQNPWILMKPEKLYDKMIKDGIEIYPGEVKTI